MDKPLEGFEPTQNIDPFFSREEGVTIGKFVIIEDGVKVGKGTKIKNFVELRRGTEIGENCFIDGYVRMSGNCRIGSNVTLRYGVTIARNVIIGNDVFIAPNVMTIHDPDWNTVISDGVSIYTAAVIDAGVTLTNRCVVGALSFVRRPGCIREGLYVGVPARLVE